MAKSKIDPMRYVIRIDNPVTRTYSWKVQIKRCNQTLHKYFADNLYGGRRAALKAAKEYRDTLLSQISVPDYAVWRRTFKRPRNTSGIVGVARYVIRTQKRGVTREYHHWQAFWKDADSKRVTRSFGVSRYGEEVAKERACAARQEGLAEVWRVLEARSKKA